MTAAEKAPDGRVEGQILPVRALTDHRLLVPLTLIGLIALFFNKMAFSNLILARGDTFLYFYPYWQAAAGALRAGRLPLWNPDIFMGAPFLANSQAGFFYPLNWPVWLLLPAPYAVNASVLVHLMIAGAGAYLAGKKTLSLEWPGALLAAALFALGGYLTAQVEHINQLQGLAWLPWYFVVLATMTRHRPEHTARPALLPAVLALGALFALQLLAGHTQTVFISGVALSLWLVIRVLAQVPSSGLTSGLRRLAWPLAAVMAGGVIAALLAAVQLLPTVELAALSSRQGGLSLNEVLSFSWHPLHLTRALLPSYGQSLYTEYVAFLPLTAITLAFVGAWAWRENPAVRSWLALCLIMVVLALGQFTPVYYLLGRLPGFDLFRAPSRWLAVAALAAAMLAGYGWQRVHAFAAENHDHPDERDQSRRALIRPLLAAGLFLVLIIGWGYGAGLLAPHLPAGAEAPYERPLPLALLGWLIEFALAAMLLGVILSGPRERIRHATIDLALLALAVLWLGSRGLPYNQLTTPEAYFDLRPPQARLLALANCAAADNKCPVVAGRFLSLSGILFDPGDLGEIEQLYAGQLDPAAIYDYIVAVKHKEVLSPNLSMITGLPAIDGFDGGILPLRAYSELMSLILPEDSATTDGRLREYLAAAPDSRWLSLFNGRYLITDKTGDGWREGVFFDQQHPAAVMDVPVLVEGEPDFEATELWLIADDRPPPLELRMAGGITAVMTPQLLAAPNLFRVSFSQPAAVEAVELLPCDSMAGDCGVKALTLVDSRDETFQPLALPPYRLIFSGDVKIYENLAVLPRAFMVYEWRSVDDVPAVVTAMRAPDFDPAAEAILIGEGSPAHESEGGRGTVEFLAYEPERVRLLADTTAGGMLVLTDAYYPGWEVTVGGVPVEVLHVDGMFRGVFLPAGQHEVEFRFRPASVRLGMTISVLAMILLAVAGGIIAFRNFWRGERAGSGPSIRRQ